MPKIYTIKSREVYKVLEKLGYCLDHTTGSHKIYREALTNKIITVPAHSKDLKIGTVRSVIKMSGLSQTEFIKMI